MKVLYSLQEDRIQSGVSRLISSHIDEPAVSF